MEDSRCPYTVVLSALRRGNISELIDDYSMFGDDSYKTNHVTEEKLEQLITKLRLSEKKIKIIGKKLRNFNNLKSLVLSGNIIESLVNAELPKNLENLELGCNLISDIEDFTKLSLPALRYLGLSFNRLNNFFKPNRSIFPIFPKLIHLDLSCNDLSKLENVICSLKTLTTLKILFLFGNPCSFVPGYRGYAITHLPTLSNFDEKLITLNERRGYCQWVEMGGSFETSLVEVNVDIIRILNAPIAIKLTRRTIGAVKDESKFRVKCSWFLESESEPSPAELEFSRENYSQVKKEQLNAHSTPALPWNEPIDFFDSFVIRCENVKNVLDFFEKEIKVSILEDKEGGTTTESSNTISRGCFTVPFNLLKLESEVHLVWTAADRETTAQPVAVNLRNKIAAPQQPLLSKRLPSMMSIAIDDADNEIICHLILSLNRQICEQITK